MILYLKKGVLRNGFVQSGRKLSRTIKACSSTIERALTKITTNESQFTFRNIGPNEIIMNCKCNQLFVLSAREHADDSVELHKWSGLLTFEHSHKSTWDRKDNTRKKPPSSADSFAIPCISIISHKTNTYAHEKWRSVENDTRCTAQTERKRCASTQTHQTIIYQPDKLYDTY